MRLTIHTFNKQNLVSNFFPSFIGYGNFQKSKKGHCNSHYLMLKNNMIFPSSEGIYHYLPSTQRCIDKLSNLIEAKMNAIGAHKMSMSHISSKSLWEKSDRWNGYGDELVQLSIDYKDYVLSPTHEEEVTNLASKLLHSSSLNNPENALRLYQITTKFRDELRPKYGLLRAREFLMKDLYTFDTSETKAFSTYEEVSNAYDQIFNALNIDFVKAQSTGGNIGGDYSHEYHLPANIGEDKIVTCEKTGKMYNIDAYTKLTGYPVPPNPITSIEVGHTFYLGETYSKLFQCYTYMFLEDKNESKQYYQMGCYGIGVTRLLAACVEQMSTAEALRFPYKIAPFKVCIIPPKDGSLEYNAGTPICNELYEALNNTDECRNDVIIDDRTNETVGWRFNLANLAGYPIVILIGKNVKNETPTVEVWFLNKNDKEPINLTVSDAVQEVICDLKLNLAN